MPDLLLELFSEEIPARMQADAAAALQKLVTGALLERGILYEGAQAFATPRRLALHIAGLPARQPDTREERKGPRVGAPEAAIQGFLKGAGIASLAEATVVSDAKKGDFYVAMIARAGRSTPEVLAEILPGVIKTFPWPKSMRWGAASASPDALRWVRPLQSIVCMFGPETEEPEIVPFEVGGVVAGNVTYGHRFMSPGPIKVRRFEDYVASLKKAHVVLDAGRRKQIILHDARDLALAQGLELVEDEALLNEVAGLVEWPVVLLGAFDAAFLGIPPEVVRATIRANQKCFVLRKPQLEPSPLVGEGREGGRATPEIGAPPTPGPSPQGGGGSAAALTNKFILVSNLIASDGGKVIAAGNERVVRARLSDALYFWAADQKDLPGFADQGKPLDQRLAKLRAQNIVFHEKLGTQGERVDRIMALAKEIAPLVGADPVLAERAAALCKADLMTEVVGEFPEVQGLMGRRYAELQGDDAEVCAAIEEHYKPQGPGDRVPSAPVSIAVALADKIDSLVGFWAIDEKPTGSKDPYALRRAALGVIRIILDGKLRPRLLPLLERARPATMSLAPDLRAFIHDRLRVHLREQGARYDLIDAALGVSVPLPLVGRGQGWGSSNLGIDSSTPTPSQSACASTPQGGGESAQDDLVMIVTLVDALTKFLSTDDGNNLLAGYKRAANILKAEEKKDGAGAFDKRHEPNLRITHEEQILAAAIDRARAASAERVEQGDFEGAMRALSHLRAPVDAFFDKVTVNDDNAARRKNRLCLLNELRTVMQGVADFSKVTG